MKTEDKNEKKTWLKFQDELAEDSGLAVVLVEGKGLSTIAESNNNSICGVLTSSKEFASKCEKYCGQVYENATKENRSLKFKCHAGLDCVAVPIKDKNGKNLVAITGRTFSKSDDYRKATERAISGDWNKFPPTKFFENVLLKSSKQSLEKLAKRIAKLSDDERGCLSELFRKEEKSEFPKEVGKSNKQKDSRVAKATKNKTPADIVVESKEKQNAKTKVAGKKKSPTKMKSVGEQKIQEIHASVISKKVKNISDTNLETSNVKDSIGVGKTAGLAEKSIKTESKAEQLSEWNFDETKELAEWRALFSSMLNLEYEEACRLILEFLEKRYQISSLAWLENRGNRLRKVLALGSLEKQDVEISMAMDDERLLKVVRQKQSIELKERNKPANNKSPQTVRLFPVSVGKDVRSALVIGERANDEELVQGIARFCETVASELEILRLREELSRRSWLEIALQKFNDSLKMIDSDDFWSRIMQTTAELLQAERGSVLVFDDKEEELIVKSAIGRKSDLIKKITSNVGKRVAWKVFKSGKPWVVPSIRKTTVEPAPSEWNYRTESFISFPIAIGERVIGVLNLADKVDGSAYQEFDLQLLRSIVPQIAVAIDHATLKNKAGEFQQLSVTDPLTGLLNRRYLEERLDEEIKRSNRHGYPMSFLMVDVDDFKSYNDKFLHTEGDKALQIVGQCLRETLRGADIAARFGGEEFSILLPQTTLDEAEIIAERIRINIETTRFPNRQVTVSIGIAAISMEIDSVETLVESADRALFAAKNIGKNNVQIFEEQRKEMRLPN